MDQKDPILKVSPLEKVDRVAVSNQILSWRASLSALALLTLVLGVLNRQAVASGVRTWWFDPAYSHCFLIVPVSAWLIWQDRDRIRRLTPVAFPRAVLLALPIVLLSLAGFLTSTNEIQQLALIAIFQVLVLALLGARVYRATMFPCLFLFFAVPSGDYLIPPLQQFTAHFVATGLSALNVPYHLEGTTIDLANGRYEIAEACAGLRFLIATVAVGALFVHLIYRNWRKIALYLAASVVVPIVANGFRALGIVLLAHWSNNRIAAGADHIIYGWGFSVVILFALMFVGSRFGDSPDTLEARDVGPSPRFDRLKLLVTACLAALVVCAVPAFSYWYELRPNSFNKSALVVPPAPAGWRVEVPGREWAPNYANPDASLIFAIGEGGSTQTAPPVEVFVDYYARDTWGHHIVSSTNKMWDDRTWRPSRTGVVKAPFGASTVTMREAEIMSASGETRLIWWTYWSDGRFTISGGDVRLDRLKSALSTHQGAALVALSTSVEADEDVARQRLSGALADLRPLHMELEAVAGISSTSR